MALTREEMKKARTEYPCGIVKPQPVTLKGNLDHYKACSDDRCKARLAAYDVMRMQMREALRKMGQED